MDASGGVAGVGLRQAIESIRADLIAAIGDGEGKEIHFPIDKMVVELKVIASETGNGKAGFKVPFVDLEIGVSGSAMSEMTSTITVEFAAPVDRSGAPVKIASEGTVAKG